MEEQLIKIAHLAEFIGAGFEKDAGMLFNAGRAAYNGLGTAYNKLSGAGRAARNGLGAAYGRLSGVGRATRDWLANNAASNALRRGVSGVRNNFAAGYRDLGRGFNLQGLTDAERKSYLKAGMKNLAAGAGKVALPLGALGATYGAYRHFQD